MWPVTYWWRKWRHQAFAHAPVSGNVWIQCNAMPTIFGNNVFLSLSDDVFLHARNLVNLPPASHQCWTVSLRKLIFFVGLVTNSSNMGPLWIKRFQNNNNIKVQLQPFKDILHSLCVLETAWLPVQKSRLKLCRSILESTFFTLEWLLIQKSRLGLGCSVLESKYLILGWLLIQESLNSFTCQDKHQFLDGSMPLEASSAGLLPVSTWLHCSGGGGGGGQSPDLLHTVCHKDTKRTLLRHFLCSPTQLQCLSRMFLGCPCTEALVVVGCWLWLILLMLWAPNVAQSLLWCYSGLAKDEGTMNVASLVFQALEWTLAIPGSTGIWKVMKLGIGYRAELLWLETPWYCQFLQQLQLPSPLLPSRSQGLRDFFVPRCLGSRILFPGRGQKADWVVNRADRL